MKLLKPKQLAEIDKQIALVQGINFPVSGYSAKFTDSHKNCQLLRHHITALEGEKAGLRNKFKAYYPYVRHERRCFGYPCQCGLDELLKQEQGPCSSE